jgi:hypothetical protein
MIVKNSWNINASLDPVLFIPLSKLLEEINVHKNHLLSWIDFIYLLNASYYPFLLVTIVLTMHSKEINSFHVFLI